MEKRKGDFFKSGIRRLTAYQMVQSQKDGNSHMEAMIFDVKAAQSSKTT
ncbi:MAG: hypothetical protein ACTTI3_00975 [Treponema sp.]